MISSLRFEGVSGTSFSLDTDDVPLQVFDIQSETRMEQRERIVQHGLYPTKQYLGSMSIHMEGKLLADTTAEYWSKRQTLSLAFQPRPQDGWLYVGTLKAQFDGLSEVVQSQCSLDGKPLLPLGVDLFSGSDLQISLISTDPFFYSENEYSATTGTPGGGTTVSGYGFPYSFPYSFSSGGGGSTSNNVNVTNNGNAPTYPTLDIYGPCVNPKISNGDHYIRFDGLTLLDTEVVEIDFLNRIASKLDGSSVYNLIDTASSWWFLESGVNTISYTAFTASAPSRAVVRWRNAYLL